MGGKSHDVKVQSKLWSNLLEGRIALQKVVVAAREIPADNRVDTETEKSVSKLLKTLVILREINRKKGQFCKENEEIPIDQDINDKFLEERHEQYNQIRDQTIEKWCEKTKIGNIPKKGYAAMELPTLQLIKNSLKDKDRLIKRTQLDRASHPDDVYHVETFNDDDFYHQLLKEMISKDESRKWVELQRLRYKQKRRAETRATKGRKIRKDLIPKLVNFMAPSRPARLVESSLPEQIRNELMKSLFGGPADSCRSQQSRPKRRRADSAQSSGSDLSEPDDEGDDEDDDEEEEMDSEETGSECDEEHEEEEETNSD